MILDTKTDVKSHQSELVVKAMEIMQKTYSDPDLNMASLADQLGISPVTLAVEFKNETGISPSAVSYTHLQCRVQWILY